MTDRTWRCSTCANEHDETMPHDTDRASAEDINELHSLIAARLTYRASAEGLRAALRMAERMSEVARDEPGQLVEVSRALFDDTIVRPLRAALRDASAEGLPLREGHIVVTLPSGEQYYDPPLDGADDGRPPIDPLVAAHDKGWQEGVLWERAEAQRRGVVANLNPVEDRADR